MTKPQAELAQHDTAFLVACLCAEWCGSCREYRLAFEALAPRFPAARFAWVDVEDEPDVAGEIDIDNFPTLVIQRDVAGTSHVLFCGAMLPHINQLERLLQTLMLQTPEEASFHAMSSPERAAWQSVADVRSRLGST